METETQKDKVKNIIEALEVSKKLPMKVKTLHPDGTLSGHTVEFTEVTGDQESWKMTGTLDETPLVIFTLDKKQKFGVIE